MKVYLEFDHVIDVFRDFSLGSKKVSDQDFFLIFKIYNRMLELQKYYGELTETLDDETQKEE